MLVTLPLILLLLDYWPLRRAEPAGRLILEKLPLLALSAAACAITLLAQGDAVHSGSSFSLPHRLGNAATSCAVYLGQMVWPARLAVLYPFPQNGQPTWEVALAAALIAGFSALAWWQRKMRPWLATGWVWYLVMLLPVAGLIQVGRQAHADRYTYLPQIGIYLALTWLVAEWRANRAAIGSLVAAALAVLMFCAWKQTAYWQDSETLWTHTLACTTDNDIAHNDLGLALFQKGRVDAAIVQYQEALKIRPDSAARNNLGLVLFQQGRVDEALLDFQEALKIKPDYAEARNNLGLALFQKGRVDEAMVNYEETLKIKPDYAEARNNLGNALLRKGKREEAITQFEMALRIKPSYGQAENNLGTTLHQLGRLGEAISHYQKAQELLPDNESVHFNFAKALLQQGRTGEAITQYQSALQIDPADVEAQNNLAWLLATSGPASLRDGNKAVQLARRANELAGGKDPVILGTLAAALAEAGQFDEARRSTQQAIALAQAAGQPELVRRLNSELLLYQTGRPFHQP